MTRHTAHHSTALARFRGFHSPNYTPVPDELFDKLLSALSGAELKALLYIIRRTFGFKKQREQISLSQIRHGITTRDGRVLDRGTGLSLSAAQTAIKGLVSKGVILAQRNRTVEHGDQATTYSLRQADSTLAIRDEQSVGGGHETRTITAFPSQERSAPATENTHGGIPANGRGGYRESVAQETGSKQTDLSVRISKSISQKGWKDRAIPANSGAEDIPDDLTVRAAGLRAVTPLTRGVGMRSVAEVLTTHRPLTPSARASAHQETLTSRSTPLWPAGEEKRRHHPKPPPELAVAVTEIAQEFGDLRHLSANCTQAMRLLERSGRSVSSFVGTLYEARAITRQQPRVANRRSYFWSVARDLLGVTEPPSVS
jgi:hypothetical protein